MQDQNFLKFRSLILRALTTAVYISEDIAAANFAAYGTLENGHTLSSAVDKATALIPVLKGLVEDLKNHLDSQEAVEPLTPWPSIQGPDPITRLNVYLQNNQVQMLLVLFKLVISVHQRDLEYSHLGGQLEEILIRMLEPLTEKIKDTRFIHRDLVIESIFYVVEVSSFCCLFLA